MKHLEDITYPNNELVVLRHINDLNAAVRELQDHLMYKETEIDRAYRGLVEKAQEKTYTIPELRGMIPLFKEYITKSHGVYEDDSKGFLDWLESGGK